MSTRPTLTRRQRAILRNMPLPNSKGRTRLDTVDALADAGVIECVQSGSGDITYAAVVEGERS